MHTIEIIRQKWRNMKFRMKRLDDGRSSRKIVNLRQVIEELNGDCFELRQLITGSTLSQENIEGIQLLLARLN